MSTGIFITGTDTGVGKSVATAGLARLLARKGASVFVMKPVQTGAVKKGGKWVSADIEFVRSATDEEKGASITLSNPYLFKRPLAPNLAARLEKRAIKIKAIVDEYRSLASSHRFGLVEGAGGLLAPVTDKVSMADLALTLETPIIIVARPDLGTINHTLLTINYARDKGISVLGLVFNYSKKRIARGESEAISFIRKASGVPILGTVPYVKGLDVEAGRTARFWSRFKLDIKPILRLERDRRARSEKISRVKELDRSFVWHPFTQMKDWVREEPLIVEKGEGSYLIDSEGNRYLDGVSSLWVTTHGHRKKEIDRAIKDQLLKIAHSTMLGLGNAPATELARELIRIAPYGLKKVFYSDSGSTAVEIALKMAFQYWRLKEGTKGERNKFAYLRQSYHGDTIGAMGVGGIELFHDMFRPLLFDSFKLPNPYCYRCPLEKKYPSCDLACAKEAERVVSSNREEIAALIVEPMVQGAAGMIVFPPGYLKAIEKICREYGILMIADEVATGFGRTGKMFACEHEGVKPDIVCLAKGITGGYLPLAATIATEEIYSAFLGEYIDFKTFFHGHTFTGNPLGCAAAIANLKLFQREKTLEKMKGKIDFLSKGLERFRDLKQVGDVRQMGFMVGIELARDKATGEFFPPEYRAGARVAREAKKRGAIIRPLCDVIVLMPHLTFSKKEIKCLLDITFKSIQEVFGK